MNLLYLTADRIGEQTGGGLVTKHERQALNEFASSCWDNVDVQTVSRAELETIETDWAEPWKWDRLAYTSFGKDIKLAHIYSGTFPTCVRKLQFNGGKVCFTIAAHDRHVSRKAHEFAGVSFDYPHLTEQDQWLRYIQCYVEADQIVCPSKRSAEIVGNYEGFKGRIEIIPHGCDLPEQIKPLPNQFTVGYMGSYGCDKAVWDLLLAWKKLAYRDALLVLAGRDSTSQFTLGLIQRFGGGNIALLGWVENISDFYNQISLYCQSSLSEGFGLEILESASYGRAGIVSDGAGAADIYPSAMVYKAGNVDELADKIDYARKEWDLTETGMSAREEASKYTWDKIRKRYVSVWREMLNENTR